jgi:glycosyltransferase involved in cell wall biosynthesis
MSGAKYLVALLGPAVGSQGGMASVIEAYLALPLTDFRFEDLASWSPDAAAFSARLWARCLVELIGSGRKRFAVVHGHLSERGSFIREGSLVLLAARLGLPTVITLHGADLLPFAEQKPRLVRAVLNGVDAVVALGPETAAAVRRLAPEARVVVIPNPIEIPSAEQPPEDRMTVLFAGETGRRKGVDVLLRAWAQVHRRQPDARLVIVGPPGDVQLPFGGGIDALGPRQRADVLKLMERSQIVVLPSRAEVMPMALLEAMARGRPVVTTNVGEIPFLLGDAGRMVAVGDHRALAESLIELLENGESAAREGATLKSRAISLFSPPAVACQLEELYRALSRTSPAG